MCFFISFFKFFYRCFVFKFLLCPHPSRMFWSSSTGKLTPSNDNTGARRPFLTFMAIAFEQIVFKNNSFSQSSSTSTRLLPLIRSLRGGFSLSLLDKFSIWQQRTQKEYPNSSVVSVAAAGFYERSLHTICLATFMSRNNAIQNAHREFDRKWHPINQRLRLTPHCVHP